MKKEQLKIKKNVENPNTHLKHNGDIQIDADVLKGATVEATGDIIADNAFGVQLIAGGDIQIRNEVACLKNNESVIYASGRFSANKVSGSTIVSEKSASMNIVENSRIISNEDIFINSYVCSSEISSLKTICAEKIVEGEKSSTLESGRSVIIDEKIASMYRKKQTLLNRLDNIKKYLAKIDKENKKEKLQNKLNSVETEINQINEEISNNADFVRKNATFGITIKGKAAAGTKFIMKGNHLNLEKSVKSSHFTVENDEIIRKIFNGGN